MRSRYELQLEDFKPHAKSNYLTWNEWSNASVVSYLNIIDFDGKKAGIDIVPWVDIPAYEDDVLRFCKSAIYSLYKPYMMNKITSGDNSSISSFLVKFMRVCDIYDIFSDGDEGSQLYCDIVNNLFDKGCEDPTVLLMLWNRICAKSDRCREVVFDSLIGKHRKRSGKILLYILHIAQETRFDFWGAWVKGHSLGNFCFCPVTAALLNANVEHMTILLQHGFQQNCQRVHTYDKYFQAFVNPAYSWLRTPLVERTSKRQEILTEILLFLVQISICKSYRRHVELQKCFQLLWDNVPEPVATTKELLEEVENRFRNPPEFSQPTSFLSSKTQFVTLCHLYEDFNPLETGTVVRPRSLHHLCKCSIRDVLQGTMNLPRGIKSLPIPCSLQLYLNVT